MKGYFVNRYTLGVTALFTLLYYYNEQKDAAAVIFVAGSLSAWILVTINFLFEAKSRKGKQSRHLSYFKNYPLGDGGSV
jgi:hypothetical protein